MIVNEEIIKTTCPRDCYDACGIEVLRKNHRIVSVRGDKEHYVSRGKLCAKCQIFYNGVMLDEGERLKHPLKRVGAKGEGMFEAVTWDTALAEIAARFGHIADSHGADNILHAHYTGTCSLIAGNFPMRFLHRLGVREVEPDTVCNMAGHVALGYTIGSGVLGFDPRTVKDSQCVMVWGANPSASAPHAHSQWLPEAPCPVIVIDPVRHATAESADLHMQLYPGTDAALAFAMMHVLKRESMIDRDFLAANTVGWDELEPTLSDCTPEWGESQTGVPAIDIERAAKMYGAGPALLWLGQGLQRQPMGVTVKVIATYERPFWRDAGLSGEVVLNGGPVSVVYDNTSAGGMMPTATKVFSASASPSSPNMNGSDALLAPWVPCPQGLMLKV